jgi:alpha-L-glutamate ligase-like protein
MASSRDILGMNARQAHYVSINSSVARNNAYSKLVTKQILAAQGVPAPALYAVFEDMASIERFDWNKIDTAFAIKPVDGNAGKGIIVIRKRGEKENTWVTVDGRILTTTDLQLHLSDILEGQYSTYGSHHMGFVEERVPIHPKLKKYVYKGTPDIRVIVFNRVPVMAMLRLPSHESEGRANLHQGAIGVGLDIATGVTVGGVYHGEAVKYLPGTKLKLNGLKLPQWTTLLTTAVQAAEVIGLRYAGVDLFIHPDKGPMIVEMNANPGLSIQIANRAGLRRRLERVEGLEIRNVDHGVRVAKALFAESFADKVKAEE